MIFSIIDRYIGRAILTTSMLVLLTLVALAGIFGFISELDDVGKGNYSVLKALQYILLTTPSKAYLLFAPAVLLGSLLGLGALASNSELTVMRAAGISNGRIIRAVLITGFALMLLIAALGETVMPKSEQVAEELRLTALDKRLSVKGRNGLWIKSGNRYVNISTVMPDFTLLDVHIHEFDGVEIRRSIRAARAFEENSGDKTQDWTLEELEITRFTSDGVSLEVLQTQKWSEIALATTQTNTNTSTTVIANRHAIPSLVSVEVLKSLKGSSESLSAFNLYDQIQYLKANQLNSRNVELAFWTKITSPFATIVMLMLSLPFVFGSQRSGGAGQKIFVGIMLGIVYVLVNKLLTQLALANGLSPFISAALPLFCFLVVAIFAIQRSG